MLSVLVIILLVALAMGATVLNTIAGGGLGVILVPALIVFFSLTPINAVGTNFLAGLASAVAAMFSYSREGIIDFKVGTILGVFAIPAVTLGSVITGMVPTGFFNPVLGVIVVVAAFSMFLRRTPQTDPAPPDGDLKPIDASFIHKVNLKMAITLVMVVGLLAGIFGAGGGLILTPALLLIGLPIAYAVGTNRLVTVIYIFSGFLVKMYLGQVDFDLGIYLAIGAVVGGIIGARVVTLQKSGSLKMLVAILISALGLSLILQVFL